MYLIFLFLTTLILPVAASGQESHVKFEHITVDQGLSQNTGRVLFQDSRGLLWVGTQDGLNRYDGYNFLVYEHNPLDPNSLSDNFIFSIAEDDDGFLWVGTNGGGLNRFDPKTDKFFRYQNDPDEPNSLSHNVVNMIYEDKSGTLWIGTDLGLNKLVRSSFGKETFDRFLIDSVNLNLNVVRAIFEDSRNNLWVGTIGGGLNRFNRTTGRFVQQLLNEPQNPKSISSNVVNTIYEDSFGDLWIGTALGLNRFARDQGEFTRFIHEPENDKSLSDNNVWIIYEDKLHTLWLGTQGRGLNIFDREKEEFIRYVDDPDNPYSLNNNIIFSILEDGSGSIWLGTGGGGINKFDRQKAKFVHYQNVPLLTNSSLDNFVWVVTEDHAGALWIGTQGGGLFHFDRTKNKFVRYQNDLLDPTSLSHNIVLAVHEDRFGEIWVGTNGGGLNRLDRKTARFKRYMPVPNDPISLSSNTVRKIFEDRDGTLWFGTYNGGINRFDRENETFIRYLTDLNDPTSLSINVVFNIYEDRSGILWIGTWGGGLNRFDKKSGKFTRYLHDPTKPNSLSHNRVRAIYQDGSGIIWAGTDYGLNKLVPTSMDNGMDEFHFVNYTKKDGLPDDVIYGILEDDDGNFWISTNNGLSKFNPETEEFKNYNVDDGLQSNEFNTGAYIKTKNGEMVFGGINGFNIFYPGNVLDNPHIPPVILTSFKKLGQELQLGAAISEVAHIRLSYQDNSFSFEFAALDFVNPLKNQYCYKLEGYDEDWIYTGNRRFANYTRVPPGNYILRVKGSNNDGVWNEEGASVRITISPPFWRRTWFLAFSGLVVLFVGYNVSRQRINGKLEKARILNELKAAHDMQMGLMPTEDPVLEGFDISGVCIPAEEVGGDYFDYLWLDKKQSKLGIAMVDVSARAMKGAMTAVMSSGMVHSEVVDHHSPSTILKDINQPMYLKTARDVFTAMLFAVIDAPNKKMTISTAGQPQPILVRNGKIRYIKVDGPSFPLGIQAEVEYTETTFQLRADDVVIFYTDGLPEAMNSVHEEFDFERFEATLSSLQLNLLNAPEIVQHLLKAVQDFAGNAIPHDDITVVVVRVM